jgi:hypothetical protein
MVTSSVGRADHIALHAPARLQRDAVVDRVEVAAVDRHAPAGVDVDPVGPALDRHAPEQDVVAIDRMDRPHVVLFGEDVGDRQALDVDELQQGRVAQAADLVDAAGMALEPRIRPLPAMATSRAPWAQTRPT